MIDHGNAMPTNRQSVSSRLIIRLLINRLVLGSGFPQSLKDILQDSRSKGRDLRPLEVGNSSKFLPYGGDKQEKSLADKITIFANEIKGKQSPRDGNSRGKKRQREARRRKRERDTREHEGGTGSKAKKIFPSFK